MIWKTIGKSITGSSHQHAGTVCDDALNYTIISGPAGTEAVVCFVSDGAGSASQAAMAAQLATTTARYFISDHLQRQPHIQEKDLYQLAEQVYDVLHQQADINGIPLEEYSCTLLGCILFDNYACFLQVGDGAIIKSNGNDYYVPVWWPHNGEYQNTTAFINEHTFRHLRVMITEEQISEIAILTDGLQMLTLDYETQSAHQPFFKDMFKWMRIANAPEHLHILNQKLEEYLNSDTINRLTDDDKTLFLATRLQED